MLKRVDRLHVPPDFFASARFLHRGCQIVVEAEVSRKDEPHNACPAQCRGRTSQLIHAALEAGNSSWKCRDSAHSYRRRRRHFVVRMGNTFSIRRAAFSARLYSCRKASIGSRREARKAGTMPLTSPTTPRMSVDAISVPGAMIRRMSPASPFLAKALYKV